MKKRFFTLTTVSSFVLATASLATGPLALAQSVTSETATSSNSETITFTVSGAGPSLQSSRSIDYFAAKSLDGSINSLPRGPQAASSVIPTSPPGFISGSPASIKTSTLSTSVHQASSLDLFSPNAVESDNYGTLNHPFTTARNPQTTGYPYSPAGKLFFNIGTSTYVCSASVIQRGVVVTAAHCVANFGAKQLYSNWQFIPAYNNGTAPYGVWNVSKVILPASYYSGTDHCTVRGVVCDNDVAVLVMNPANSRNVGDYTGWYGIAYGGFGYTSFLGKSLVQLTQIGYPVSLDNGLLQQRNDSLTYIDNSGSNQQIIGSLMTGGSSGGPWLINYGQNPTISSPNTAGQYWTSNPLVTGVTSWGYSDPALKEQGASIFTASNILSLYNAACTNSAQLACK